MDAVDHPADSGFPMDCLQDAACRGGRHHVVRYPLDLHLRPREAGVLAPDVKFCSVSHQNSRHRRSSIGAPTGAATLSFGGSATRMFQFARTHVSVTQAERSSGFLLTHSVLYGHEGVNIAETSIQDNNPSALRNSGSSQVRPVSDRYRSRLGEHNELVVEISPADHLRRPRVQEVCPNSWRHLACIRLKLRGDAARAAVPISTPRADVPPYRRVRPPRTRGR